MLAIGYFYVAYFLSLNTNAVDECIFCDKNTFIRNSNQQSTKSRLGEQWPPGSEHDTPIAEWQDFPAFNDDPNTSGTSTCTRTE